MEVTKAMSKKKILLVDDSSLVIKMEKMILPAGYDIVVANDGQEAIQRAIVEQPDLIVMDVNMPHMSGFEACEAIRKEDGTRDIPIIIVTTKGDSKSVETGFAAGCNDYITKPIDSLEFLTKVRNYVSD